MPISVEAASVKHVRGNGVGMVTCLDGSEIDNVHLGFFANKDKGRLEGSAGLLKESFLGSIQPIFHKGVITIHQYNLVGILASIGSEGFCPESFDVTVATLSGPCGENVKIEFTTRNGLQGEFTGNVVCTV